MVKFRSWNEKLKSFVYFENGEYNYSIKDYKGKSCLNFDKFNWQNAEQFTNKFDMNNKEAFVGDKILFNHCGMMKEACVFMNNNTGAFYLDNGEEIYYPLDELRRSEKTFEIIGNIHEEL